jgi:hypothetical protein
MHGQARNAARPIDTDASRTLVSESKGSNAYIAIPRIGSHLPTDTSGMK